MKKLNVKFVRSYRSKNGNVTFVYTVTGDKTLMTEYQTLQKDFYREDEQGVPLWFTTRFIGDRGTLLITSNNKIVPDMSAYDQAASISSQYGGNFGNELARAAAAMILHGNNNVAPEEPTE